MNELLQGLWILVAAGIGAAWGLSLAWYVWAWFAGDRRHDARRGPRRWTRNDLPEGEQKHWGA